MIAFDVTNEKGDRLLFGGEKGQRVATILRADGSESSFDLPVEGFSKNVAIWLSQTALPRRKVHRDNLAAEVLVPRSDSKQAAEARQQDAVGVTSVAESEHTEVDIPSVAAERAAVVMQNMVGATPAANEASEKVVVDEASRQLASERKGSEAPPRTRQKGVVHGRDMRRRIQMRQTPPAGECPHGSNPSVCLVCKMAQRVEVVA